MKVERFEKPWSSLVEDAGRGVEEQGGDFAGCLLFVCVYVCVCVKK